MDTPPFPQLTTVGKVAERLAIEYHQIRAGESQPTAGLVVLPCSATATDPRDSQTACANPGCRRDIWVGDQQRNLLDWFPPDGGILLCYPCAQAIDEEPPSLPAQRTS